VRSAAVAPSWRDGGVNATTTAQTLALRDARVEFTAISAGRSTRVSAPGDVVRIGREKRGWIHTRR
jgi:hypothetical protein